MIRFAKLLQKVTVLIACLGLTSYSAAQDNIDADSILNDFKSRTFIPKDAVATWAGSIENVVGVFVTKSESGYSLAGNRANEKNAAKKIELKDREVFNKLISSSQNVGLSIVNILNLGGNKDKLDQLIISDIVSVTDPDVTVDKCNAKKPDIFDASTTYWCITGVTLSKIAVNKFTKQKKLAKGSYGVATADGTFQKENNASAGQVVASVTLVGPIKDGKLVTYKLAEPASNKPVASASVTLKSMSGVPPIQRTKSGLEGAMLTVPSK